MSRVERLPTPVEVWAPAFAWLPDSRFTTQHLLAEPNGEPGRRCRLCEMVVHYGQETEHLDRHLEERARWREVGDDRRRVKQQETHRDAARASYHRRKRILAPRTCANPECGSLFQPTRADQRFCKDYRLDEPDYCRTRAYYLRKVRDRRKPTLNPASAAGVSTAPLDSGGER